MRKHPELLKITIIDTYGHKIYSSIGPVTDRKTLQNLYFILIKYGVDLKNINEIIKEDELQ